MGDATEFWNWYSSQKPKSRLSYYRFGKQYCFTQFKYLLNKDSDKQKGENRSKINLVGIKSE